MSTAAQRKRRNRAAPQPPCPSAKSSRVAYIRRTTSRTRPDPGPPAASETIAVMNATQGGEEVVDLTCDASDLPTVVDLTNNDSVVLVDEDPQGRREAGCESYVVSSDEDDAPSAENVTMLSTLQEARTSRTPLPGTISCPVCMDSYSEIVDSGRLVVSTKCGHIFCSQCLKDSLNAARSCPTCRSKLTHRQYHPIYI